MQLTQLELNQSNSKMKYDSTQSSNLKQPQQSCRICLEQLLELQVQDLCLCKGQNSLIHQKCLLEWIKRANKYQEFPNRYFYLCDICRTMIYLETEATYSLRKWGEIRFFERFDCCSMVTLFVLLIGLSLILQGILSIKNRQLQFLVIFGIASGGLVVLVSVLIFIYQMIIRKEVTINGIVKKKKKQARKDQVIPQVSNFQLIPQSSFCSGSNQRPESIPHLRDFQH